jgi:hypothetical protein
MEQKEGLTISLPLQISELAQVLFFAGISVLSFFVPFGLGHPQWLVGTAVNACLFLSVIYLPRKYYLPFVILPSLGVLARGIIFGPFTLFLVYFLPFIWLGNVVLILVFKNLYSRAGFIFSGILASVAKFLLLFLTANLCFNFHWVPKLFMQAMGLNQLVTALSGGLISFILWKSYQTRQKN